MFATGVTVGLAEWIIDDTCLVFSILRNENNEKDIYFILFGYSKDLNKH